MAAKTCFAETCAARAAHGSHLEEPQTPQHMHGVGGLAQAPTSPRDPSRLHSLQHIAGHMTPGKGRLKRTIIVSVAKRHVHLL